MRVLLTGATGYLGVYTSKEILKRGWKLRALVRKGSKNISSLPKGIEIAFGSLDFQNEPAAKKMLSGVDVVVHAGYFHDIDELQDPLLFFKYNVSGTVNFMEYARRAGVKQFVFISSCASYGTPVYNPIDELHPCNPTGGYAAYKAAVDAYVYAMAREWKFNICSLRIGHVFGIFRDTSRLAFYNGIKDIIAGKPVDASGVFNLVHVEDAAKAVMKVIGNKKTSGEIYNVLNDRPAKVLEMAKYVKAKTGSKSLLSSGKSDKIYFSNAKFRKLGFKFSNSSGVKKYLDACVEMSSNNI